MEDLIAAIVRAHPAVRDQVEGATDAEIDELGRCLGKKAGPYAPLRVTRVQESPGRSHERSLRADRQVDEGSVKILAKCAGKGASRAPRPAHFAETGTLRGAGHPYAPCAERR